MSHRWHNQQTTHHDECVCVWLSEVCRVYCMSSSARHNDNMMMTQICICLSIADDGRCVFVSVCVWLRVWYSALQWRRCVVVYDDGWRSAPMIVCWCLRGAILELGRFIAIIIIIIDHDITWVRERQTSPARQKMYLPRSLPSSSSSVNECLLPMK